MREPEPEVPLAGGHMTEVVRVGDTVRRTAGRWTPTIHALLRHVRAAGFTLAPEPLGIDQRGREILTFLPGVADGAPEVVHATRRSTPSRGCAAYLEGAARRIAGRG